MNLVCVHSQRNKSFQNLLQTKSNTQENLAESSDLNLIRDFYDQMNWMIAGQNESVKIISFLKQALADTKTQILKMIVKVETSLGIIVYIGLVSLPRDEQQTDKKSYSIAKFIQSEDEQEVQRVIFGKNKLHTDREVLVDWQERKNLLDQHSYSDVDGINSDFEMHLNQLNNNNVQLEKELVEQQFHVDNNKINQTNILNNFEEQKKIVQKVFQQSESFLEKVRINQNQPENRNQTNLKSVMAQRMIDSIKSDFIKHIQETNLTMTQKETEVQNIKLELQKHQENTEKENFEKDQKLLQIKEQNILLNKQVIESKVLLTKQVDESKILLKKQIEESKIEKLKQNDELLQIKERNLLLGEQMKESETLFNKQIGEENILLKKQIEESKEQLELQKITIQEQNAKKPVGEKKCFTQVMLKEVLRFDENRKKQIRTLVTINMSLESQLNKDKSDQATQEQLLTNQQQEIDRLKSIQQSIQTCEPVVQSENDDPDLNDSVTLEEVAFLIQNNEKQEQITMALEKSNNENLNRIADLESALDEMFEIQEKGIKNPTESSSVQQVDNTGVLQNKSQISELSQTAEEQTATKAQIKAEMENQLKKIDSLKKSLNLSQTEISKMESQKSQLVELIQKLQGQIEAKSIQSSDVKTKTEQLIMKFQEIKSKVESLHSQNVADVNRFNSVAKKFEQLKQMVVAKNQESDQLKAKNKQLETKLVQLQNMETKIILELEEEQRKGNLLQGLTAPKENFLEQVQLMKQSQGSQSRQPASEMSMQQRLARFGLGS